MSCGSSSKSEEGLGVKPEGQSGEIPVGAVNSGTEKKITAEQKKSAGPEGPGSTLGEVELSNSLQTVTLKDSEETEEPGPETTSKLQLMEIARLKIAEVKKAERKRIWLEETRMEIRSRKDFQISLVEECRLVLDDWQHVLRHLEGAKDRAILSRMTLDWWELLKKDRTSFLFREVFQVLFETVAVTTPELLGCRQVSKEWKSSVDCCIQDPVRRAQHILEWKTEHLQNRSSIPHAHFFAGESAPPPPGQYLGPRRQQHHEQCGCPLCRCCRAYSEECPFITRGIELIDWPEDPQVMGRFVNRAMEILGRWGTQLGSLSVSFDMSHATLRDLYNFLRHSLSETPNLQNLRVMDNDCGLSTGAYPLLMGRANERNIFEWIPLPELPYLRALEACSVPLDLQRVLLHKYGATLEVFFTVACTGVTGDYINGTRLPHLKQFLYLMWEGKGEAESSFSVDWPSLEELGYFHGNVRAKSVPVIFRNLNGFGKTLRKLVLVLEKLHGPISKVDPQEIKSLSLELPLVEKLTLFVSRVNLGRIDFILPMVSLKELHLYYGKSEKNATTDSSAGKTAVSRWKEGEPVAGPSRSSPSSASGSDSPDEIIQFSSYTNRLYASNIWNLFPELETVTINIVIKTKGDAVGFDYDQTTAKRKCYTRDGFKRYLSGTE